MKISVPPVRTEVTRRWWPVRSAADATTASASTPVAEVRISLVMDMWG
jgi:hypothetical protein